MRDSICQQSQSIEKATNIYTSLRRTAPGTKRDLKNYIKVFLGLDIPDKKICPEHNSPMDYLWYAFRDSPLDTRSPNHVTRAVNHDCIVLPPARFAQTMQS